MYSVSILIIDFVGGVDYNSGPYTAIFPAGSTNATFNVTIIDDDLLEANENIFLKLSQLPIIIPLLVLELEQ